MARLSFLIPTICVFVRTVSVIAITNEEFSAILKGRCEEYQRIFQPIKQKKNCNEMATAFLNIFTTTSAACSRNSYEDFVRKTQHHVPANKGMLWSGIKDFVEQISLRGKRYMPITFTLTGYMLDDLSICKDVMASSKGCEGCDSNKVDGYFWDIASEYYVKSLNGSVIIILSARRVNGKESIYYNGSILATTEIPNLSPYPTITSAEVWPIQSLNTSSMDRISDKCNRKTVKLLKGFIDEKKIPYKCVEPSKIPLFAMCLNNPELCSMPATVNSQTIMKQQKYHIFVLLFSAIAYMRL